jgi:hypothetical protein
LRYKRWAKEDGMAQAFASTGDLADREGSLGEIGPGRRSQFDVHGQPSNLGRVHG